MREASREELVERLAEAEAALKAAIEATPLRAILDWYMCSDPWPGGDQKEVTEWLNHACRMAGYRDWVYAYHKMPSVEQLLKDK